MKGRNLKKFEIEIFDYSKFRVKKKYLHLLIQNIINRVESNFERLYISFIDREKIFYLNKTFLNHKTDTDILTFSYVQSEPYQAELFISSDMAIANAEKYKVPVEKEIIRLIVHGILHVIGYKDKTLLQKKKMRAEENKILNSLKIEKFIKSSID